MSYLEGVDATNFSARQYLLNIDPVNVGTMLMYSETRRALTKYDPLLFAILYMQNAITDKDTGAVTFSDIHFELCRYARTWIRTKPAEPMEARDAFLAPRDAGKSTWLFKILPLWAAAHGHVKFVAAFTAAGPQATRWMSNVKREIDGNELLRLDFPDLCVPAIRESTGRAFMDNQSVYSAKSGFIIAALGIDGANLGLNIDDQRPDLIIFDDIEQGEETYSMYQKEQRLKAVIDSCMGMNIKARVCLVGTTVMMGSIFHDLVMHNDGEKNEDNAWVEEQRIRVHHYEPFVKLPNGKRRSVWPRRWSLKFLESIELTIVFAKNWMNRPIGRGGDYWTTDLLVYGTLSRPAITILSIDPAVKDKKHNDYTAMGVISFDPLADIGNPAGGPGAFEIVDAVQMRVAPGQPIVQRVKGYIAVFPHIFAVLIEDNQGGMLWNALFHDLPCELWTVTQTEPKWVRAQRALNEYQLGKVMHRRRLTLLERQMLAFPRVMNDDLVDMMTSGISELRRRYAMPLAVQGNRVRSY